MGEEYGERAPFLFFTDHSDPRLIEGIIEGRKKEYEEFHLNEEPYDPQSTTTFEHSRLDHRKKKSGNHKIILNLYRKLAALRIELPVPSGSDRKFLNIYSDDEKKTLLMIRRCGNFKYLII